MIVGASSVITLRFAEALELPSFVTEEASW